MTKSRIPIPLLAVLASTLAWAAFAHPARADEHAEEKTETIREVRVLEGKILQDDLRRPLRLRGRVVDHPAGAVVIRNALPQDDESPVGAIREALRQQGWTAERLGNWMMGQLARAMAEGETSDAFAGGPGGAWGTMAPPFAPRGGPAAGPRRGPPQGDQRPGPAGGCDCDCDCCRGGACGHAGPRGPRAGPGPGRGGGRGPGAMGHRWGRQHGSGMGPRGRGMDRGMGHGMGRGMGRGRVGPRIHQRRMLLLNDGAGWQRLRMGGRDACPECGQGQGRMGSLRARLRDLVLGGMDAGEIDVDVDILGTKSAGDCGGGCKGACKEKGDGACCGGCKGEAKGACCGTCKDGAAEECCGSCKGDGACKGSCEGDCACGKKAAPKPSGATGALDLESLPPAVRALVRRAESRAFPGAAGPRTRDGAGIREHLHEALVRRWLELDDVTDGEVEIVATDLAAPASGAKAGSTCKDATCKDGAKAPCAGDCACKGAKDAGAKTDKACDGCTSKQGGAQAKSETTVVVEAKPPEAPRALRVIRRLLRDEARPEPSHEPAPR